MILQTNRKYIEALATGISGRMGVKIAEGNSWSTDIKHKTIYYPMQDLLKYDPITCRGLILHETAHVKLTKPSNAMINNPIVKEYPQMHSLYNALDDIRIEYNFMEEYGDFARQAFNRTAISGDDIQYQALTENKLDDFNKFLMGLLSVNSKNIFCINDRYMRELWYRGSKEIYNLILKIVNDLEAIRKVKEMDSTDEIIKYANDMIFPEIKHLLEKNKQGGYNCQSKSNPRGLDPKLSNKQMPITEMTDVPSHQDIINLISPFINTTAKKLLDILKENKLSRYNGNKLSGKLLQKDVYKVAIPNESRLFSKKTNPHIPDYEISIVLDKSGSMRNNGKMVNAYVGAVLLEEIAKKLKFKVNNILYDDDIYDRTSTEGFRVNAGGGNDDFRALEEIERITDKTKDNLVFIMTDGACCNDPKPIVEKLTKQGYVINAIGIDITDQDYELMRRYYPDLIRVNKLDDLPKELIRQLSRLIHR